jgi:hypothetical protein
MHLRNQTASVHRLVLVVRKEKGPRRGAFVLFDRSRSEVFAAGAPTATRAVGMVGYAPLGADAWVNHLGRR